MDWLACARTQEEQVNMEGASPRKGPTGTSSTSDVETCPGHAASIDLVDAVEPGSVHGDLVVDTVALHVDPGQEGRG